MLKKDRSRHEVNKLLRRIFAKHCVDLSLLSYSAGLTYINLTGILLKLDGSEFTVACAKNLAEDICEVGQLTTDLANWELYNGIVKRKANYYKKINKAG